MKVIESVTITQVQESQEMVSRDVRYEELTHVAAVAIAAAECLRRTRVSEGER